MAEVTAEQVREASGASPGTPWRRRRWLLLAVILGVVALLSLLFWGLRRGPTAPTGAAVPLNKPAPDFAVTTIDGKRFRLSDLRGQTVVLNVWASWCVPCVQEAAELNRSYAFYQGRNVAFVGIAWNDDEDAVQQFVSQQHVPYTVALDLEGRIAIDLGITGVPETFLIDPQGQLVQKWVGPITSAQLNRLLAPLAP